MLARIGGGNSGIVKYLEEGMKQGRFEHRDDIDNRVILDGDIRLLDSVINNIEDRGQNRYLHISLSFYENDIDNETLKSVSNEYKDLLMSAYDVDEYCFYSEAHIPKVKNVFDERTGEYIERKPHIHIVIPRQNLLTGKSTNPVGDLNRGKTLEYLDAIQEHINYKYKLASPKDGIRVSDNNHANVLSRVKGDTFKGVRSKDKEDILNRLDASNISTDGEFLSMLSEYGEHRVYNKGKASQYFGVKFKGDEKFTRLKSPVFSSQYIKDRSLPLVKPSLKKVEKNLIEWKEKASFELKYIHPASKNIRVEYGKLNNDEQLEYLSKFKGVSNERLSRSTKQLRERGQRGSKRSATNSNREQRARYKEKRLPPLRQRNMVYQLQGFRGRRANESNTVLPPLPNGHVAKARQDRQYNSGGVRRSQGSEHRRINLSSDIIISLDDKPSANELKVMRDIRASIDPHRFLSYCVGYYRVNAADHSISYARDNSPRFKVGKRNLNASDFLTKHLGLTWQDARADLIKLNDSQIKGIPYPKVLDYAPLNEGQKKDSMLSRRRYRDEIKDYYKSKRQEISTNYTNDLKSLNAIKDERKREVMRGFYIFIRLQQIDKLNTITKEEYSLVNAIHDNWQPDKNTQLERLNMLNVRRNLNNDFSMEDNMILNDSREATFTEIIARRKKAHELEIAMEKNLKLTSLVASKERKGKHIRFLDKESKATIFIDKGSHIKLEAKGGVKQAGLAMEYAVEKYGGKLRLTGSDQFKSNCAIAAAEKGLNVILKPDKYHEMMLEHIDKMQKDTVQKEQAEADSIRKQDPQAEQAETQAQDQKPEQQAPPTWNEQEGGFDALSERDKESATTAYNKWKGDRPENSFGLKEYVSFVQERHSYQNQQAQQPEQQTQAQQPEQQTQAQQPEQQTQAQQPEQQTQAQQPDQQTQAQANWDAQAEWEAQAQQAEIQQPDQQAEAQANWDAQAEWEAQQPEQQAEAQQQSSRAQQMIEEARRFEREKQEAEAQQPEQEAQQPEPEKSAAYTIDDVKFTNITVSSDLDSDTFKASFKDGDKQVMELTNIKETDLNKMGIDTKGIDMRSIDPVNLTSRSIAKNAIKTPLTEAKDKLKTLNDSVKGVALSKTQYAELTKNRAELEEAVEVARATTTTPQEESKDKTSERDQARENPQEMSR